MDDNSKTQFVSFITNWVSALVVALVLVSSGVLLLAWAVYLWGVLL